MVCSPGKTRLPTPTGSACRNVQSLPAAMSRTLSPVHFESKSCGIAPISCNFKSNPGGFLCTSDCMAEGETFEPSVQLVEAKERLLTWCATQEPAILLLSQLDVPTLRSWIHCWRGPPPTRHNQHQRLRTFSRFCLAQVGHREGPEG